MVRTFSQRNSCRNSMSLQEKKTKSLNLKIKERMRGREEAAMK
jgi:hypothetical protein